MLIYVFLLKGAKSVKFICDILLNFNDNKIYDFYEWNSDDDIEYFKKVPIIKVSDSTYRKIAINSVVNSKECLNSIYNVTELYDSKKVRRINYAAILTNGQQAIAVLLNSGGKITMISRMLIDEEEEAIDIGYTLDEQRLDINANNLPNIDTTNFLTRFENRKLFFLNKEIDELYKDKNLVKLKYLYYECSHEIEDNIDMIYNNIKLFLNTEWNQKHNELYDLVRLSYSKK